MKRTVKIIFSCLTVLTAVLFGAVAYLDYEYSSSYYIAAGETLDISHGNIVTCEQVQSSVGAVAVQKSDSEALSSYDMDISILGIIPVKTVHVSVSEEKEVLVLGTPFGIKIYTEGVLVVGFNDVSTHNGTVNPSSNAGIQVGDTLLSMNGNSITCNNDVLNSVLSGNGKAIEFTVKRDGRIFSITVNPVVSSTDNQYKIGLWIRDSSAGIGTLTFYSPSLGIAAGLGHGICDVDTGNLIPLENGEFVEAEIVGIKKSTMETTGELQGVFSGGQIAELVNNDSTGVYGTNCTELCGDNIMKVAMKQEITVGKAKIITTIDGEGPKAYDCEIKKIYHNDSSLIKNMVIKVTDSELIEKTGGIVQGMSGSPIIQNGKFVGAVTHVFVDDCTCGYAIFAENMLKTAQSVMEQELDEVS